MTIDFPRATPESAGIPSREIHAFIKKLSDERLCMHDVLLLHDGNLIYEGYWSPMNRDFLHRLYSCSKSFVSVAVGAAIGEGLLDLDDPVNKFFPDKVPENQHPWQAAVKIRDLLRMASCYTQGATYTPNDPDWADTWFAATPSHEPGRVFNYDTAATTMLCIIIARVTGKEFMDYLRVRVFDKIGFDPANEAWCVETPCGHHWGGSGVVCRPYDFARFAQFCMNYGNWNGEQLVPEWYMREATSKQIDNLSGRNGKDNNGYGYQFWTRADGGFSLNGMGGQFAICLPDKKLILVTHAYEGLGSTELIFEGLNQHILPYIGTPIEENADDAAKLSEYTASLKLPTPNGKLCNDAAIERINGRTYQFGENEFGWKNLRFDFTNEGGTLSYANSRGEHCLSFALGAQASQDFPETVYYDRHIGTPSGQGYLCYTSAAWSERICDGCYSDMLTVWCQICGSHLGQLHMTFSFAGDSVTVSMRNHAEWFLDDYSGFATANAVE